jgi:hypothetical protein
MLHNAFKHLRCRKSIAIALPYMAGMEKEELAVICDAVQQPATAA